MAHTQAPLPTFPYKHALESNIAQSKKDAIPRLIRRPPHHLLHPRKRSRPRDQSCLNNMSVAVLARNKLYLTNEPTAFMRNWINPKINILNSFIHPCSPSRSFRKGHPRLSGTHLNPNYEPTPPTTKSLQPMPYQTHTTRSTMAEIQFTQIIKPLKSLACRTHHTSHPFPIHDLNTNPAATRSLTRDTRNYYHVISPYGEHTTLANLTGYDDTILSVPPGTTTGLLTRLPSNPQDLSKWHSTLHAR